MSSIKTLIKQVLESGYLLSLASVDENGPWVSDLIYIEDDKYNLYFISRPEFRHSKAFIKNPHAAGAITAVEKPEGKSTGVQLSGTVMKFNYIPAGLQIRYAQKRGSKKHWDLEKGESWYKFTPSKIDLIYEPVFGFTKKTLEI